MTVEHTISVGLDDIKAVTFECNQCHAKMSVSPDNGRVPTDCRQCGAVWLIGDPSPYPTGGSPYTAFLFAIGKIRASIKGGMPFAILLEFNEE